MNPMKYGEEYAEIYNQIQGTGSGMIVLLDKPNDANVTIEKIVDETDDEKATYVLRTEVSDATGLERFLQNFGFNRAIYDFHMEGWAGNYNRPIEFFMSLHTATMAPEFVYRVATDYEIDTKVYIRFFETKAKIELIGPNDETLEDIKAQITEELLSSVSEEHEGLITNIIDKMQNNSQIPTSPTDIALINVAETRIVLLIEDNENLRSLVNLYNAIVEVQTGAEGKKLYIPYILFFLVCIPFYCLFASNKIDATKMLIHVADLQGIVIGGVLKALAICGLCLPLQFVIC